MAKKEYKVLVERDRCKGCGLCVEACPKDVLALSKEINAKGYFFSMVMDQPACIGCKFCATTCPDVAIEIYQIEPEVD